MDVAGVLISDSSYLHVGLNTDPFPAKEYGSLVHWFLHPVDLTREKTLRNGSTRHQVYGQACRLQGYPELLIRVNELRAHGNHVGALVSLRLAQEYQVALGSRPHGCPWLDDAEVEGVEEAPKTRPEISIGRTVITNVDQFCRYHENQVARKIKADPDRQGRADARTYTNVKVEGHTSEKSRDRTVDVEHPGRACEPVGAAGGVEAANGMIIGEAGPAVASSTTRPTRQTTETAEKTTEQTTEQNKRKEIEKGLSPSAAVAAPNGAYEIGDVVLVFGASSYTKSR
jgi:hypothetical protein